MKSPLWIFNNIILIFLIIIFIYISYSWRDLYTNVKLYPMKIQLRTEFDIQPEVIKAKDVQIIEKRDIFNTYKPQTEFKPPRHKILPPVMPSPPKDKEPLKEEEDQIKFLDPLPIKISGIIYSSNELKSYVTLINNNTKKSETYSQGDKIMDAYIIRILPNKIILIRSNGQQETVFTSEEEALKELNYLKDISWDNVVAKLEDNLYSINLEEFKLKVNSLAQLIDMLDATTSYKNGVPIGIKIGNINSSSIGYHLGLVNGDIILKINNIEPTNSQNRIDIYENIVNSVYDENFIVEVEIIRDGKKFVNNYFIEDASFLLKNFKADIEHIKDDIEIDKELSNISMADISPKDFDKKLKNEKELNNLMDEQEEIKTMLQDTINQIKDKDKKAMRNYGAKRSVLKNLPN